MAGGRGGGRGERGSAAVEFAIVLPILVLVLFGVVDFSIAMYDKTIVTSASREGARFGAMFRSDPDRPSCNDIYPAAAQPFEEGLISFEPGGPGVIALNCLLCTSAGACTAVAAGDPVCSLAAAQANSRIAVEAVFTYRYLAMPDFVKDIAGNPLIAGTIALRSTTLMNCE
jgi:hypothetical protein